MARPRRKHIKGHIWLKSPAGPLSYHLDEAVGTGWGAAASPAGCSIRKRIMSDPARFVDHSVRSGARWL